MRREKKTKKIKVILVCIILVILVVVGIVALVKNIGKEKDPNAPVETDKSITYSLPNTTYNNMEVTGVELEYLKENKQTMVTMLIKNTSGAAITSQQSFLVRFLNQDDIELTNAGTVIEALDIDAETSVSLILTGDFTSIKKVVLENPQAEKTNTTTDTETTTGTETD